MILQHLKIEIIQRILFGNIPGGLTYLFDKVWTWNSVSCFRNLLLADWYCDCGFFFFFFKKTNKQTKTMSTRFNIAPPPHVKVRWVEGKVMGSRAIQWLTFRMHRNFIWGVVPMSYPCYTRVVTVSYLPYHVIIFQKLLLSLYHTRVHVNVLAS